MKSRKGKKSDQFDISQKIIRAKINRYLTLEHRPAELIQTFTKGHGYCHGLAALAAYAQYLESLTPDEADSQPRDDWHWLKQTLKMISHWNEERNSLSPENKTDIERFLSHIIGHQRIYDYLRIGQGNLHLFMEDTADRQLKLEYTLAGLFTANDFMKILTFAETETTLIHLLTQYQKRLILISCGNHSLSLFRSENILFLYNANHHSGRQRFQYDEKEALINRIFKAYKYDVNELSPLGFRIFTFDGSIASYPAQKKILDSLNNPHVSNDQSREVDYSALHIATRIGSEECVNYYLEKGAILDSTFTSRRTPLHIAATRNYPEIAMSYISRNADINYHCHQKNSPLVQASQAGHIHIVKLMLDHPPNARFKNLLTALNHLSLYQSQLDLIKSLDKNTVLKMIGDKKSVEKLLIEYKHSKHYDKQIYSHLLYILNDGNTLVPGKVHENITLFAIKKRQEMIQPATRIKRKCVMC